MKKLFDCTPEKLAKNEKAILGLSIAAIILLSGVIIYYLIQGESPDSAVVCVWLANITILCANYKSIKDAKAAINANEVEQK